MREGLTIGCRGELDLTVSAQHAIHLNAAGQAAGQAGVAVFSTPSMINLMELAAREALSPWLEAGEESVGMTVNIEHTAATPLGARVRATATVTAIRDKLVDFEIEAFDEGESIGRGTHRRAVIRVEKFRQRLADKTARLPTGVIWPMMLRPDTGDLPSLRTLQVALHGPLARVTLNRPNLRNAVDRQMTADFEALLAWLAGHRDIRVVTLTGAGQAFCAGDDVKEVATLGLAEAESLSLRQARMYLAMEELPQVFIAAVNGPALGGGCVAACACDMRIAASNAAFGMPEILLGWPPGYGLAQLTHLVGKARAIELCTTGRQVLAEEALRIGMVNRVVPHNRLAAEVESLTGQLLRTPPEALRQTKRLIHADEGDQSKIAHLADTNAYIHCLATDDAREGIAAFLGKRPARFVGP